MTVKAPSLFESIGAYQICCPNCKKPNPLSAWGFVRTYWYENPRSCFEGGNWWPTDDIMQCLLVCPNKCLDDKTNLATRIIDLKMDKQEKDWVLSIISDETSLYESKLLLIFSSHYVQHGAGKEIRSSEEIRRLKEEALEIY